MNPYCQRKTLNPSKLSGNNENKIWEPSKGGIGIKLNNPRTILYKTTIAAMVKKLSGREGMNLIINPKIKARVKLDKGPANETFKSPHLLSLKFMGLIGTGLAHPIMGIPENNKSMGKRIEPTKSRWTKGFKDNLPSSLAVESPKA